MGPEWRLTTEPSWMRTRRGLEVDCEIMESSRLGMLRTDLGESEGEGAGVGLVPSPGPNDFIPYAI